jgi:hypothetical protein
MPGRLAAKDQTSGGARAWKRRCGEIAASTSAFAQNRTAMLPAGWGDAGAAAGLTELAKTMTAQMAQ